VRAVLDPNVLISALIWPTGAPREILAAWMQGHLELVVSPQLLAELRDVLARPKFRRWASRASAAEYADGLEEAALLIQDPPAQPGLSPDPGDDYLITLACAGHADYLISGDHHLTGLTHPNPPILTPRQFRDLLTEPREL